jgi:hypothetical protein
MMPALSREVERNGRYSRPPSLFSQAGQVDRQHEGQHTLAIRDAERRARDLVANSAVEAVADIAWVQARAKVISETKFTIERASKESAIIAGEDPILKAKFEVLDDEYFMQVRCRVNKPKPQLDVGLFD